MKPFDLDEARQGNPIQTRNGRKAQFVTVVNEGEFRVLVLIDSQPAAYSRMANTVGRVNADGTNSVDDLFMVGRERKVWANIYSSPNAPAGVTLIPHESYEQAREYAERGCGCLATVPIEYVA